MSLRLYSQVSSDFPHLNPGWSNKGDSVVLSNPKFGTIFHVAVCDNTGKPLYDQPVWSEPIGAVIVPVDEDGKIAFIENYRPAIPQNPAYVSHPPSISDLAQRGRFSLELPRGFSEPGEDSKTTAKRETQEETNFTVIDTVYLGQSNTNTTFYLNNTPVWLTHISRKRASDTPDMNERIKGVCFLELKKAIAYVHSGEIVCGVTKSALLHYLAWLQCA